MGEWWVVGEWWVDGGGWAVVGEWWWVRGGAMPFERRENCLLRRNLEKVTCGEVVLVR